jgi:arginine exporter protein ArgO
MERQRQFGTILMAIAAVQSLIFLIGVLRRSYLAIAVPVAAAMAAVTGILFWVGYTMTRERSDLADLDMEEEETVEAEDLSA